MELTPIVDLLYTTKSETQLSSPYVYCEMALANSTLAECATENEAAAAETRDAQMAKLSREWTVRQRTAFARLRTAATAYREAHVDHEVHPGGTLHATLAIGARGEFEDALLATLEAFEAGQYPGPADFPAADRDLNAAYRAVMAEDLEGLGLSRAGIREAQRAWIAYRDAWAGFAAARFPSASTEAIKASCTRERTKALKAVTEDR